VIGAGLAYPEVLIAWGVAHFVWQGSLLWVLGAASQRALQRATPAARYRCALALVGACVMAFGATIGAAHHALDAAATLGQTMPGPPDGAGIARSRVWPALLVPWVAGAWTAGVLATASWTAGQWLRLRRLAARAERDERTGVVVRGLAPRAGLRGAPDSRRSAVVSPFVIGIGAGILILPTRLPALTAAELHALLLHELAHVRRRDYAINLVQRAIDCALWFHPAVWALSAQARHLREQCCDAEAVARGAAPSALARALVRLDATRGRTARLALAAVRGPLVERVRQLRWAADGHWVSGVTPRIVSAATALIAAAVVTAGSRAVAAAVVDNDAATRAYAASAWAPDRGIDIQAHDPAGVFSLHIVRGRVQQAEVDGVPVPREAVEQHGDTLWLPWRGGAPPLVVELDPRGTIRWHARPAPIG
jgi:beta-lactamase regulating signal transducer with metallopeptidase domain